jgi:hypothetical protein
MLKMAAFCGEDQRRDPVSQHQPTFPGWKAYPLSTMHRTATALSQWAR